MIFTGSSRIETLRYRGQGRYVSATDSYPLYGTLYTLRVDVPGETGLRAVSHAPVPTPITYSSIELQEEVGYGLIRDGKYRLEIRLADPPGKNFYRLGVYRYRRNQRTDLNSADSVYTLQSIETVDRGWYCGYNEALHAELTFESSDDTCQAPKVTDRLFDGKEFSWTGTVRVSLSDAAGRDELLLLLSSLSENYVEYQRTLVQQRFASGPFVEPTRVYSNVEGGLGIFAGYTNTMVIFPLSE